MDIPTLLVGSGFALFVVLLAWGNQIREPRRETRYMEEEFRKEFNLQKSDLAPLLRGEDDKLEKAKRKYSFMDEMTAIISIMEKKTLKKKKHVELLTRLKKFNAKRSVLEKLYGTRYKLTFILMLAFFILGSLSLFDNDWSIKIMAISLSAKWFYLCPIPILIMIIMFNFIKAYFKEESFVKEITDISDLIEGG